MLCDKQVDKANDNGRLRLACLSLQLVFLWSGSRGKLGRGEVLWSCLKIADTRLLLTPLPDKSLLILVWLRMLDDDTKTSTK